jgi:hypothetical protein
MEAIRLWKRAIIPHVAYRLIAEAIVEPTY